MNPKNYRHAKFSGKAGKLFTILLVNFFLTIVTLGIYYPWAKAKLIQYFYSETEFSGSRFVFHGTGKEMFKGFIKVFAFIVGFTILLQVLPLLKAQVGVTISVALIYWLALIALIPLAIHGSLRYRLSRSSWRGIHFAYNGEISKLYSIIIKGLLLTIFSLGIYAPWFTVSIRAYIMSNVKFGNLAFKYNPQGAKLLGLNILGVFFCLITFGIYVPWYLVKIKNFHIRNTFAVQNETEYQLESTMAGLDFWLLSIMNTLTILFTLGLGTPFVIIRDLQFNLENIHFSKEIDFDNLEQVEGEYKDATGDDLADALDIAIF